MSTGNQSETPAAAADSVGGDASHSGAPGFGARTPRAISIRGLKTAEAGTFASLVASQAIAALAGLVSTRFLTPSDKGLFTGAYVWSVVSETVVALSVPNALMYFGALRGQTRPTRGLLSTLLILACAAGAAVGVTMGARRGADGLFVVTLAALPPLEMAFELATYSLLSESGSFRKFRLMQAGGYSAVGIPAVLITRSADVLLLALFASYLFTIVGVGWALHHRRPQAHLGTSQLFRWALHYHPGLLLSLLAGRTDVLLVTALFAPFFAGQYAAATALPSLLAYVGTALGLSLVGRVASERHRRQLPSFANSAQVWLMLGSLGVTAILLLVGPTMLRVLFGAAYLPASAALFPLSLAVPVWNLSAYQTQVLSALGRSFDLLVGQSLAATILLAGSVFGASVGSLQIVGWANVAAYSASSCWQMARLHRPKEATG
jgi:O-antigen/teichoic acid export membrane protein